MTAPDPDHREWLRRIAREAMRRRGLWPQFSSAVQDETHAITGPFVASGSDVRDLRSLPWSSIDNDDSRDLDQLTVSRRGDERTVNILVAVSDVDALVRRGSAIDEHAANNTTSVYTFPQIFPMLPERLSTDLTSLAEGEDRAAVVVDMAVMADGSVGASSVYRAMVHNHAKLAYASVSAWLTGVGAAPSRLAAVPGLEDQLRTQDRAAQALRGVRHAHGALTLENIEAVPVYAGAVLSDLRPDRKNRAQELIEDFMIAANGVTARFLAARGLPALRRVLRTPRHWDRIKALAAAQGAHLPSIPSAIALNEFLVSRRRDSPQTFADLSLAVIKLLGRGEYAVDVPGRAIEGHFGLAVGDYTHSTAPNRRFPDLLTQRLIKATLSGRPVQYSVQQLTSLAAHCTAQEDNAAKVERQVNKSAAALLLTPRIGDRFDAIVTGAAAKGTWVRISSPTVEGRLVSGAQGLEVGERVRVELAHTDVERGFIDFERR